ncbi:MAG TPA: ABC transporter permease [Candidatus Mediterraneibacter cottocaccae]|nr:ABC transporter permease [Candidatus Mediterraneibacter cottocaccae]
MRLYKMELYKLLGRKFFLVSLAAGMALLFLYFWFVNVGEERSTVNGTLYTGYEAVRTDRRITEEFRGTFTDETARQIIDRYGFPSVVEEYYGGFRDENYLNGFVTEYLGNGYFSSWDDYRVSDDLYPLADTELGKAAELTGKELVFDYVKGWGVLLDTLQMGMVFASILILIGISPVFAEERQCRTAPLLFTSEEGKNRDVAAKAAAAFTLAVLVYAVMAAGTVLMVGSVYGTGGGECMSGIVMMRTLNTANAASMIPVSRFVGIVMALNFLAIVSLCAITLCVSAYFASLFQAVSVSCMIWLAPLMFRILFGGAGYILAAGMPLFLIMYGIVEDWYRILFIPAGIALAVLVCCTLDGCRKYRASETV